ncbi:MAG: hypothetical protein ACOZIN_21650 [Myxococcota bacterium]
MQPTKKGPVRSSRIPRPVLAKAKLAAASPTSERPKPVKKKILQALRRLHPMD